MDEKAKLRPVRSSNLSASPESASTEDGRLVRLTLYTPPKKEFAIRYLALKKHKSINRLINDYMDSVLQKEGIDPETLPKTLP